jgi:hypothetical protein
LLTTIFSLFSESFSSNKFYYISRRGLDKKCGFAGAFTEWGGQLQSPGRPGRRAATTDPVSRFARAASVKSLPLPSLVEFPNSEALNTIKPKHFSFCSFFACRRQF